MKPKQLSPRFAIRIDFQNRFGIAIELKQPYGIYAHATSPSLFTNVLAMAPQVVGI